MVGCGLADCVLAGQLAAGSWQLVKAATKQEADCGTGWKEVVESGRYQILRCVDVFILQSFAVFNG